MIEDALQKSGVKILRNSEVTEVLGGENVEGVILKDGTKIRCQMIICGIGVVPAPLEWLKTAGLNVGNAILADEFLATNLPDVWTAGDIAEYKDLLLEENIQLGNWVNAHEQGRVAGVNMTASANISGAKKTAFKFISFYTTQGAGVNIAFVGDARPLPDREIIQRGSPEINSYCRILLVGKELVGATMINRTQDLSTLSKLIENNIDVSTHLAELADPNFDLKSLLVK
jgi:NAD(P)H-nitrite reductase large subunit